MKVAWDLDGTIYYNFLEIDFFGFVDRWGGRDKILPFNHLNPQVRPGDVDCVLTFRPEWWREQTEAEIVRHGMAPSLVLMNPGISDAHPHDSVRFKAEVLNRMRFDAYIDNDEFLRVRLQPLTRARCMSVEEYYREIF